MLHIGDKEINLAVKNGTVLYVGSRKMGPIVPSGDTPTPPTPSGYVDLTDWDFTNNDGVVTITGYKGSDTSIVMPGIQSS